MGMGSSAPFSLRGVSLVMWAGPAMAMRKVSVRYIRLTPRLDLRPVAGVRATAMRRRRAHPAARGCGVARNIYSALVLGLDGLMMPALKRTLLALLKQSFYGIGS